MYILIIAIDMSRVKLELNQEFDTMPICGLCCTEANEVVFNCFQVAKPLSGIAPNFFICTGKFPSALFQYYWSQQTEKMKDVQLKISDVDSKLWQPVFEACCTFLEEARSMKLVLSEVDRLLDDYRSDDLHQQLKQLDNAICKCLSKKVTNQVWVKAVIQRMEQYRSLRQHAETAKTFLLLQETLGLNGDFGMVKKLSTEVIQ